MSSVTECTELDPKTESYYRAIIELAQENGIDVAVVVTPYLLSAEAQSKYLTAERIAVEYGVPFYNCNLHLSELELELESDYTDDSHMNAPATMKLSDFIGGWLKTGFDIPDRRGDERYASYDRHAAYVKRYLKYCDISDCSDVSVLARLISDPSYVCFVSVDGAETSSDANIRPFLDALGIDDETASGVCITSDGHKLWQCTAGSATDEYLYTNPWHDILLRHDAESGENTIIIDRMPFKNVANGVNLIVYDPALNIIVRQVGINMDDGYALTD